MEQGVRGRYMSDYGINHIEVDKLVKFCKEARGEDLVLLLRAAVLTNEDIAAELFTFTLEHLITETYKGNNEYTKLNHVRICNHRIALLSFVWRVFLSLRSWRVAACFWFPCPYHITALPNRQLYYSH